MYQYLLLDAARMGVYLDEVKMLSNQVESLYILKKEEFILQSVAPYLCNYSNIPKFQDFYYENGWGNSWGIIIGSTQSFQDIYKHFRKFLMVKTEEGEELYFRFYDPRVLRIFLPTCDASQLKELFGAVDYFLMEDEDKGFALKFTMDYNGLRVEKMPFESINKVTISQRSSGTISAEEIKNPVKPTFDIFGQEPIAPKSTDSIKAQIKKPNFNIFD